MMACPRFSSCNAPKCPLDPCEDMRVYIKGEAKCTLDKGKRMELAQLISDAQLPRQGMTKREWAGYLSWRNKSKDEQKRMRWILEHAGSDTRYRKGENSFSDGEEIPQESSKEAN